MARRSATVRQGPGQHKQLGAPTPPDKTRTPRGGSASTATRAATSQRTEIQTYPGIALFTCTVASTSDPRVLSQLARAIMNETCEHHPAPGSNIRREAGLTGLSRDH